MAATQISHNMQHLHSRVQNTENCAIIVLRFRNIKHMAKTRCEALTLVAKQKRYLIQKQVMVTSHDPTALFQSLYIMSHARQQDSSSYTARSLLRHYQITPILKPTQIC